MSKFSTMVADAKAKLAEAPETSIDGKVPNHVKFAQAVEQGICTEEHFLVKTKAGRLQFPIFGTPMFTENERLLAAGPIAWVKRTTRAFGHRRDVLTGLADYVLGLAEAIEEKYGEEAGDRLEGVADCMAMISTRMDKLNALPERTKYSHPLD